MASLALAAFHSVDSRASEIGGAKAFFSFVVCTKWNHFSFTFSANLFISIIPDGSLPFLPMVPSPSPHSEPPLLRRGSSLTPRPSSSLNPSEVDIGEDHLSQQMPHVGRGWELGDYLRV